jgi:hypothetical protein
MTAALQRAATGTGKNGDYGHHQRLGYRNVCARLAPKILIKEHKTARKNTCAELLQHTEKDEDVYVRNNNQLRTVHHYGPLTKRRSMVSHLQLSPRKKKIQDADY